MLDINAIRNDRAKGEVDFMGAKVTFVYRPAMITPKNLRVLLRSAQEDELAKFVAQIVAKWDITSDGQPVEITPENVLRLPLPLIRMMAAYMAQEVPQKELGED